MKKIVGVFVAVITLQTISIVAGGDYGDKSDCNKLKQLLSKDITSTNQQSLRNEEEIKQNVSELMYTISLIKGGSQPCAHPNDRNFLLCKKAEILTQEMLNKIKMMQRQNPTIDDNRAIRCQFHTIVEVWKAASGQDLRDE